MEPKNWARSLSDTVRAETIVEALKSLWLEVLGFLPDLIGAAVILLLGYIIAKIVQKVFTTVLKRIRLDVVSERVGLHETLQRANIGATASEIVGRMVFWVIMLSFLIPSAETLGLGRISETINSLIGYLPRVIGASLIVIVGLMVAHFIRNLVRSGAESVNLENAEMVSRLAFGVLIVIVAGLAIGQLRIETHLLNRVIEITLIVVGVFIALALGLGGRSLAHNLMAGFYARELYRPGVTLKVGEEEGTLEVVGPVTSRLKTPEGHLVYLPNSHLVEKVVRAH